MKTLNRHLALLFLFLAAVAAVFGQQPPDPEAPKFESDYDRIKDRTTLRLLPVKISGEKGKYHSLHMSPSFSYPGQTPGKPSIIDFELQTVVKGRLRTDLYVVFIVDGETIFLSSSRWAVKRPVPGRTWTGERLVFRMPYETLLKIASARNVEIKMDAVRFVIGEPELQSIRQFATQIKSMTTGV